MALIVVGVPLDLPRPQRQQRPGSSAWICDKAARADKRPSSGGQAIPSIRVSCPISAPSSFAAPEIRVPGLAGSITGTRCQGRPGDIDGNSDAAEGKLLIVWVECAEANGKAPVKQVHHTQLHACDLASRRRDPHQRTTAYEKRDCCSIRRI